MRINIDKLNRRGWLIDINNDKNEIAIYPKEWDDTTFTRLVNAMDHDLGLNLSEMERLAEKTCKEIQKLQIMALLD